MRKNIIILIFIIIALIVGGGFWYFTARQAVPSQQGEIGGGGGTFPTGGGRDITGGPGRPGGEESGAGSVGGEADGVGGVRGGEARLFQLIRLTNSAVSGASAAGTSTSSLRYMERSTGNIYEINFNEEKRNRVSNTTILRSYDSFWSPKADKLAFRYFDDKSVYPAFNIFSGEIIPPPKATSTATTGVPVFSILRTVSLPSTIKSLTVSPVEDKFFYLDTTEDGSVFGVVSDYANKTKKTIFSFAFSELGASWPSKDIVALISKPSGSYDGFLYFLNVKTESFYKVLGGIKGLTVLVSPDAGKVIYSVSSANGMETNIFDVNTKEIRPFDVIVLPEKCVFSKKETGIVYCAAPKFWPSALYPDDWYQGSVSFEDNLWRIDYINKLSQRLTDANGADAVNLFLSADENYLAFTNKRDGTLWSVRLR